MDVSAEMWRQLASAGSEKRFRGGAVLLRQGDSSTHVLLLRSGRVKVFLHLPNGDVLLLAVREQGEVLGFMGVLGFAERSATVVAIGDCVTRVLPAERFLRLVRQAKEEGLLLRLAMARIREGEMWRAEIATLPAGGRVAHALLRLAVPTADGASEVPLLQVEIGQAVGLSRSVVAAELAGLRRAGIVRTLDGRVVISDLTALRALAGSGQPDV